MQRVARVLWTAVPIILSIVMAPAASAAFPGENGVIAFGRTNGGQGDIWTVGAGGHTTRLTDTPRRNEAMPDWNAAATKVAYARCGQGKFSNCDIWVMDADGSNQTRLTHTTLPQETWPTWSPDGAHIAYTSNALDDFQDIWVMDADGSNQTRLTPTTGFDAFPEWSPDGTKIAFSSDRSAPDDIWVIDADGGDPTRLTTGAKVDERPDWAPDGSSIAFSRNGNIWVMDADGSNETQLTANHRPEFAPTFSPDGLRIAFNRGGGDDRFGVWTMPADGSVAARQRTFGLYDFFPDWQPI
jgi:Tol biopolymer transport system component